MMKTKTKNTAFTAILTVIFAIIQQYNAPLAKFFAKLKVTNPTVHLLLGILFSTAITTITFFASNGQLSDLDWVDIAYLLGEFLLALLGYSAGTRTTRYIDKPKIEGLNIVPKVKPEELLEELNSRSDEEA